MICSEQKTKSRLDNRPHIKIQYGAYAIEVWVKVKVFKDKDKIFVGYDLPLNNMKIPVNEFKDLYRTVQETVELLSI